MGGRGVNLNLDNVCKYNGFFLDGTPYMPACCPGKKLDQRTSLGMSYIKVLGLFECSLRGVSEVLNLYVFIFCIFKAE